jgi:hypothetical protein
MVVKVKVTAVVGQVEQAILLVVADQMRLQGNN